MWAVRLRHAAVVAILLGGGLWLAGPWLIETALEHLLTANGAGPARLHLQALGPSHAAFTDIELGSDAKIRIARLELDYRPTDLIDRRIETATVTGLDLPLSLAGGLKAGPISLGGAGGSDGGGLSIGKLELRQARITLATPYGAIAVAAEGAIELPLATDLRQGIVDLAVTSDVGQGSGRLTLTPGGKAAFALERTDLRTNEASIVGIAGTAAATLDAHPWQDLKLQLTAERLELPNLQLQDLRLDASGAPDAWHGRLSAATTAAGSRIDLALALAGLAPGPLRGELQGEIRLGAGFPPLTLQLAASGLDLAKPDQAQAHLDLATPGGRIAGTTIGAARLGASLTVSLAGGVATLTPTAPVAVSLASLKSNGLALPKGVKITVSAAAAPFLRIDWAGPEPGTVGFDIAATMPAFGASIAGQAAAIGDADLTGQGNWHSGGYYAGKAHAAIKTLTLPALKLQTAGATADLQGTSEAPLKFAADLREVVLAAAAGWLPPAALHAEGTLADLRQADFTFHGEAASGHLAFSGRGSHDLQSGKGSARLRLKPLEFAGDKLQPADVAPALKDWITEATGKLALSGSVGWAAGQPLRSDLRLLVEDLSFTAGSLGAAQLNSVIALSQIWPPVTPARQEIAVGVANLGLPLSDGLIGFDLRQDGSALLQLQHLQLAGGTVTAHDIAARPLDGELDAVLDVTGVELEQLLSLGGLDGAAASGTLAGHIPIRLRGETAEILGGRLDTAGPGTISYRPQVLPAALQGQDQGSKLLVAALQNLHYKSLWLSLDRAADGETIVGLHISGANPDLYGGYPVELNVNLTGKLDQIVRKTLEGYRVPDQIRQRMLNFGDGG